MQRGLSRHTKDVISPHTLSWVFIGLTWLFALGWCWRLAEWAWFLPRVPDLNKLPDSDHRPLLPIPRNQPSITVIVPARNEEAAIAASLSSLLRSEGVRLQVIAVNDRSTDSTGEIMDAVAEEYAQRAAQETSPSSHSLAVVHIKELPSDWLGKPHALAVGAQLAQADWLLFTDGDVLFAPDALARALDYARAHQTDHLVMMPDWILQSLAEAAMHGAMHALSIWTLRLWRVADPKARDFLGIGAFNLIRRNVYDELGGFTSLRMEVLEDLRLGWKVKRAGYRQQVVLGHGLVSVRWSEGAWGVVQNLEKNLFALYRYQIPIALGACAGLLLQVVWPLVALFWGGWATAGAVLWYAAIAGVYISSQRVTRVPAYCAILYPVGAGLFCFAHLRSIGLALWRGGVMWRGTLYRLKDLRAYAGKPW
jgi:glycosyltransferase involved in cell wall biosynthesis